MADDLDPAAVERAARQMRVWLLGLGSLTLGQVDDLAPKMARAALAAARDGETVERPTCCQGWEWVPSGVGEPHNGAPERYDREPCAHVVDGQATPARGSAAPTVPDGRCANTMVVRCWAWCGREPEHEGPCDVGGITGRVQHAPVEGIAPTVTAEQVDAACYPHQDPNGPDIRVPVVAALRDLGIEVRKP